MGRFALSFFFLSLALFCIAANIPEEENVLVLNPSNFDEGIKSTEYVLVEFYAPWCGHCKKLAPEYASAATQLKASGVQNVRLAKVDASEHKDLGGKYGVRGFPTLKFFKAHGAAHVEYTGGRTASEIITWITRKSGPAATTITTADQLDALKSSNRIVVVGFFDDVESENAKNFLNVANTVEEAAFGITSAAEVKQTQSVTKDSVILFKSFDEGQNTYAGDFSVDNLKEFITTSSIPTVVELNPESIRTVFGGAVRNIFLYFHAKEKAEGEQFSAVAKANKGKLIFASVDTTLPSNKRVVDYFGITSSPDFRLVQLKPTGDMLKYKVQTTEYSEANLQAFLDDFHNDKLSPHLKTEEVPSDWDSQPVKVLVGKNHDEVVFDPNTYVFVEYYAPWCGHCKNLAPTWEKLAEAVASNNKIVIAKMDATANEVKDVSVTGFPTLKFFPAGTKQEIVDYNGGRDLDSFITFLEEQTGLPLRKTPDADYIDDQGLKDEL